MGVGDRCHECDGPEMILRLAAAGGPHDLAHQRIVLVADGRRGSEDSQLRGIRHLRSAAQAARCSGNRNSSLSCNGLECGRRAGWHNGVHVS